jgi:hypothetical protein
MKIERKAARKGIDPSMLATYGDLYNMDLSYSAVQSKVQQGKPM